MTFHSHARGKWPGNWLVNCDVCGINISSSDIYKRWDGLLVCKEDYEVDHPQKYIRVPPDPIAAPFVRPESVDGTGNTFIPQCTIFGNQAVAGAAVAGCSVNGTWARQSRGGSVPDGAPAPFNPEAPAYPDPNSLLFYFKGDGTNPNNKTLTNRSPQYPGEYSQIFGQNGFTNSANAGGYFDVGWGWNASGDDRISWGTLESGVSTLNSAQIDSLNFTVTAWYFSPTIDIAYRGFTSTFQNNFTFGIGGQVSPPNDNRISIGCSLWTVSSFTVFTPIEWLGWHRAWVSCVNGFVSIYYDNTLLGTTTVTLTNPLQRYVSWTGAPQFFDTGGPHPFGLVDDFAILKDIGIPPSDIERSFPATGYTRESVPASSGSRYWRLTSLFIQDAGFEVSELRFTDSGGDILEGAIYSNPANGAAAAWIDNNLTTRFSTSSSSFESGTSHITWDYGSRKKQVTGFKQGGYDTSTRYINRCIIQKSDDALTWITAGIAKNLTYPGNFTLSPNIAFTPTQPAAIARYWRIGGIQIFDRSNIEISELRLTTNGVDIAGGTLTSTTAPGGSLANLQDNNFTTIASWPAASVETPTWFIQWDFGAGNEKLVTGFKQGGYDNSGRYIQFCVCEYSLDGVTWVPIGAALNIPYPGNFTLGADQLFK